MIYPAIIMATAIATLLADQALSMIARHVIKHRRVGRAWNDFPSLEAARWETAHD